MWTFQQAAANFPSIVGDEMHDIACFLHYGRFTLLLLIQVVFDNVRHEYSSNEDLLCEYHFNNYMPQEGDRIGIFLLGWTQCKDYLMFEFVPIDFGQPPVNSVCFYSTY